MDAQRAVAWRSGGPNVASSQSGSRWDPDGEHHVASGLTIRTGVFQVVGDARNDHAALEQQVALH
jgi:hypothetical protein